MQIWKKLEQAKLKKQVSEYIIMLHHVLCREYGWIPFEEFKKLPITTAFDLLEKINEDFERQRNEVEKAKRRVR